MKRLKDNSDAPKGADGMGTPSCVNDANGEVQTREAATVCQIIGLIRDGYAS